MGRNIIQALMALALVGGLSACGSPPPAEDARSVVVVHGLGRTPLSMAILASRLETAGFRVFSFGYPSTSETMEAIVELLEAEVMECCPDEVETVNFVTHSMGGVVVRSYLGQRIVAHRGRVVMLSPPSHGSEIVDAFSESPLLESILGPVGSQLGTGSTDLPSQLRPVRFSLGIIAGNRSLNPLASWLIPGPDDGKVGVERAKVEGAADFMVIPATHTFIMNRGDVADEVVHFLREGRFRRADP